MGGRRITDSEARAIALFVGNYVANPEHPFPGMGNKWPVTCFDCGSERSITLHNVVSHGAGCKVCDARRRADATRTPYEVASRIVESHGGRNLSDFRGKLHPVDFECATCGLPQTATLNRIERGGWACSQCRNLKLALSREARAARFGWTVLDHTPVADKYLCQHRCGLVHSLRLRDLGRYGEGCPVESTSGFRSSLPGYLYLIRFPDTQALKIGVSNYLIQQHGSNGHTVELLHCVGPVSGSVVQAVERQVVARWRDQGLPVGYDGPRGTESVPERDVDQDELVSFMEAQCSVERGELIIPSWLDVRRTSLAEIQDLIVAGHYTHTAPKGSYYFGLYHADQLIGGAIFGPPSYPKVSSSVWLGGNDSNTTELKRLYIVDALAPNVASWFVSRCLKGLPVAVEVVVAFSDASVGHHGGIHQATNFRYLGASSPSYHYESADGEYLHKRTIWNQAQREGVTERALSDGLTRIPDAPKYRYAYPRSRRARRLIVGLPYPKPDVQ